MVLSGTVNSPDVDVPTPVVSDDATNRQALNLAEWDNDDLLGNYGTEIADTSQADLTLKPIPTGTIVHMFKHPQDDETIGYTFEATNAIDVVCT